MIGTVQHAAVRACMLHGEHDTPLSLASHCLSHLVQGGDGYRFRPDPHASAPSDDITHLAFRAWRTLSSHYIGWSMTVSRTAKIGIAIGIPLIAVVLLGGGWLLALTATAPQPRAATEWILEPPMPTAKGELTTAVVLRR